MMLVLHGAAGGWDELAVAIVAFGVLWIAVKLAGRRPAGDDDDEDGVDELTAEEDLEAPAHPPAAPLI
jgi:hypothetical protein